METCAQEKPECLDAPADIDRERLFNDNLEWAARIARKVKRKLPPSFQADDLIQEAHIELWKRVQLYDPAKNDNFQGYAYLPVRCACLMACRRRAYRDATGEKLTPGMISREPLPDQQLIARVDARNQYQRQWRKRAILKAMIGALSSTEAYLVARVYLDGVPVEEVAAIWGQPKQELSSRLAGAIRSLKKANASRCASAPGALRTPQRASQSCATARKRG